MAEEPVVRGSAFRPLPWKDFRIFADETISPEDRYAEARRRATALGCNETVMGKIYRCLLLLTLAFFTFACEKDDDFPAPDVDRTVLVYLASDNNLYRFALQNLNDMKSAMKGLDGNLLVYIDEANGTSRLSKIESDGTERVIETYGKENSASAAVLRRVVDRALTLYPAESYGLILWSHGMGWIPAGIEETGTSSGLCCPRDTEAYPVTKHFGADTENGSSVHMEIPDLVAALPDGLTFDFILFDACFMGGVEVLYEMRHAAHYLIASPAEILGSGFPYDRIIPLIFSERLQLEEVCRQFMAYYRAQSGYNRSGSITLIRADQLDGLAAAARDVWSAGNLADVSAGEVQPFERMHTHKFFDLADYYSRLVPVPQYSDFDEQLSRTVLFSDYTDRIYSAVEYGSYGFFDVRTCCGLSTYIPHPGLPSHNEAYRSTAWARAMGAGGQ